MESYTFLPRKYLPRILVGLQFEKKMHYLFLQVDRIVQTFLHRLRLDQDSLCHRLWRTAVSYQDLYLNIIDDDNKMLEQS